MVKNTNAVPQKILDKAVALLNKHYDNPENKNSSVSREFFLASDICSEVEIDRLISALEGLDLIVRSKNNIASGTTYRRTNACKVYFEHKRDVFRAVKLPIIISILSALISLAAFIKSFFP